MPQALAAPAQRCLPTQQWLQHSKMQPRSAQEPSPKQLAWPLCWAASLPCPWCLEGLRLCFSQHRILHWLEKKR